MIIRIALAALLLSLAQGCAGFVQSPTVALKSAALGEATPKGVTVNFDVDVANPNPLSLPISAAKYKIGIAGVTLLDDAAKPQGALPANGTISIRLPVTLSYESLLKASSAIRQAGGDLPYTFDGALDFSSAKILGGASVEAPVRFSGTLPLKKILADPMIILKNPAARELARQVLGGFLDGKL